MDESRLFRAMQEPEFEAILASDDLLKAYEAEKHNPRDEFFELMTCLSRTFYVEGLAVQCITPAIWAYLYAIGSPFACGGEICEIDCDVALYLLHNGVKAISASIVEDADGFCKKHGIPADVAERDIRSLIYMAFRPLEMLQSQGGSSDKPRFDLDWLTRLASVVCPLTNKTSDEVIYDMSLTECYYYCIQRARETDVSGDIRRRNSSEVNELIYKRTMELGEEYLKHIDESAKSEA